MIYGEDSCYVFLLLYRMSLLESELAMSETKVNELSLLLSKTKEEQVEISQHHQNELKREREVSICIFMSNKFIYQYISFYLCSFLPYRIRP